MGREKEKEADGGEWRRTHLELLVLVPAHTNRIDLSPFLEELFELALKAF